MELNNARVYRQTTMTKTTTTTMSKMTMLKSPCLENVRLTGYGEQIFLTPAQSTTQPPTPIPNSNPTKPSTTQRPVINQLMIFQSLLTWSQFCGESSTAASPGHNQNLCSDRRLTIAICHKLPELAHNLRMTTQPNK